MASTEEARDDEALERSAAYDELLRAGHPVDAGAEAESIASSVDVPAAGIIRLLHEVFRTPRADTLTSPEPLPERVSRFVIQRLLGRGAFGCVYLAHDPILRRHVALKVFHPHLLADDSTRRHVLREREIMARLQHPNIVPVWEAGEEDALLYIASEYCPGPTLAQWLADREQRATELGRASVLDPASLAQTAAWIARLADAVHHSHERGIVHRDLKPGNVLLEPQEGSHAEAASGSWRPRLTDFGLAKYFHAVQDETRTGLFVGSLEYASPEQVRGQSQSVGPASDIYALGVLLYELLTDELPHTAESDYELARKICDEDVTFPAELRSSLPRDLQAIALRALEREPRNRYASAADMRDDLQRYLNGEFVAARPVSLLERAVRSARKNPEVAALSGLCLCYAALLVAALVSYNRRLAVQSSELKQALVESQTHEVIAQLERSNAFEMQRRAEESERHAREVGYLANMRLAYEAWEKNNLIDVRQLLERAAADAPSLRGPAWYLLHRELTARFQPFPHLQEPIYGLAYQPSTRLLFTANEVGKVRRWDIESQLTVDEFQLGGNAHALAIAPNHKMLAVGQRVDSESTPNVLSLWDLESHQVSKPALHSHATTIESIEYSPDGKWLASGPRYEPVIVSNLVTGDSFAIASSRRNNNVAFSEASDRVAVQTAVDRIEVYDLATRELRKTIITEPYRVASFAWLPNQEVIAASVRNGWGILLYSTQSGKLVGTLTTRHAAASLAVSSDGHWLVLGSEEGHLQVFDVSRLNLSDEDAQVLPVAGPDVDSPVAPHVLSGVVSDVEFVGPSQVAASDEEGNLACLDWAAHAYRRLGDDAVFWKNARWESEDELTIFSSTRSPESRSLTRREVHPRAFPINLPVDVVIASDGSLCAAFTQRGELAVFDAEGDTLRFRAQSDPGNATAAEDCVTLSALIAHGNDLVFTTGENNRLTAWRVADGTIAWEDILTNTGRVMAEDPETGRLFVGGDFETLRVYDIQSGKLLDERGGGNGVWALAIDSAAGRILSGHCDGTLRIQDLEMTGRVAIHRSHGSDLSALTLTPDGSAILSGDASGSVRVWHGDGQPFGVIYRSPSPHAKIEKFLWSPDGTQLAILVSDPSGASEIVCWPAGPISGK